MVLLVGVPPTLTIMANAIRIADLAVRDRDPEFVPRLLPVLTSRHVGVWRSSES
jgi:hypothetical protein